MNFDQFAELRIRVSKRDEQSIAEASIWVQENKNDEYAVPILQSLLMVCRSDELIELARELLSSTRTGLGFRELSKTLVQMYAPSVSWVIKWIHLNPKHVELPFVISMLLEGVDDIGEVSEVAANWFEMNRQHQSVNVVARALVRHSKNESTLASIRAWIKENPDKQLGSIQGLLLEKYRTDELVLDSIEWLRSHGLEPDAACILVSLLEAKHDPEIVQMAYAWIQANREAEQEIEVLERLIVSDC